MSSHNLDIVLYSRKEILSRLSFAYRLRIPLNFPFRSNISNPNCLELVLVLFFFFFFYSVSHQILFRRSIENSKTDKAMAFYVCCNQSSRCLISSHMHLTITNVEVLSIRLLFFLFLSPHKIIYSIQKQKSADPRNFKHKT